jgi:Protein of unknown function (DUF808).
VVHGVTPLHHAIAHFVAGQHALMQMLIPVVANLFLGFVIGALVVAVVKGVTLLRGTAK